MAEEFTEQESLQVINQMIQKVKSDFHESGISALLWGSVILFCCMVSLLNLWLKIEWLNYVWLLTFAAIVPQVILSIKESRQRKYKTYTDDAMSGIWISFGVAIFMISFYSGRYQLPHATVVYLTLYGMPTFATGLTHRFKPMIAGGVICWALAVVSFFINNNITDLIFIAMAAFFAWLLPGIILRRKYLNARRQYV